MTLDLLTIDETAQLLRVHPKTVRRAIQSGGLRACQIAGRGTWRIMRGDLEAWIEQRATVRQPAPPIDLAPLARAGRRRRPGSGVLTVPAADGRR